jgi:hypothetical protein
LDWEELRVTGMPPESGQINEVFQDLIVSVLAVNNYSLDKAYRLCGRLRELGLLDLSALSGNPLSADEIRGKLIAAGYRRGEYIETLISKRIERFFGDIRDRGCADFLLSLDCDSGLIAQRLSGLYGVGPRVVSNFVHLRGSTKPGSD